MLLPWPLAMNCRIWHKLREYVDWSCTFHLRLIWQHSWRRLSKLKNLFSNWEALFPTCQKRDLKLCVKTSYLKRATESNAWVKCLSIGMWWDLNSITNWGSSILLLRSFFLLPTFLQNNRANRATWCSTWAAWCTRWRRRTSEGRETCRAQGQWVGYQIDILLNWPAWK